MRDAYKIVLTGASRGLGLAMTEQFVELGHVVAGCCRDARVAAKLTKRFGSPHRFDAVDVSDATRVNEWARTLLEEGPAPDLLANNAAVINANAPLWETPLEEFDRVVDVNIKGVFYVLRAFAPAMIARGSGVIVNFSSGWGRSASAEVGPYCTSKWAIEGMTRALAEELPAGMAAVPLNPGVINTEMLQSCFGEGAAAYPDATEWAKKAAPFLLQLGPRDNGRPLTAPS